MRTISMEGGAEGFALARDDRALIALARAMVAAEVVLAKRLRGECAIVRTRMCRVDASICTMRAQFRTPWMWPSVECSVAMDRSPGGGGS